MNTNDKKPADDLASLTFTATSGEAAANEERVEQQEQDDAQAFAALEAGMSKIILGALKTLRTLIAKRLPEIKEEWPDAVLAAPADAAMPLVKKYLPRLMDSLGQYPEIGMFAFSLLPLVMGYMTAVEKHEATITTVESAAPDGVTG